MIQAFFKLLGLFSSGLQLIPLPGRPVDLFPDHGSVLVLCIEPASLCRWWGDDTVDILTMDLARPEDVCLWLGEPAVSDPGTGQIVLPRGAIETGGEPAGICQVNWFADSDPSLAVSLHGEGLVVLVNSDETVTHLGTFPGARGVASCDADRDGDDDLFVSCCGSGVFLAENRDGIPVVHSIGNISDGVKRVFVSDVDRDGLDDVAGIACSSGGAVWWRNPGNMQAAWRPTVLDSLLQGPKNIWCSGDSVLVASLYSPVFFNFSTDLQLPQGFVSIILTDENYLLAGHYFRFLAVGDLDQY